MLAKKSMAVWADGTYGLCCFFEERNNLKHGILDTFYSSEYDIYRAMQEIGYPIKACENCISKYCYDSTPRHYSEHIINDYNNSKIEYLHYSLSNICNIACRTCCAENSSRYSAVYNNVSRITKPLDDSILSNDLNKIIPSLKHFTFHGGEPLLSNNVFEICDILNNNKNISIQMITNCTQYDKLEIFLKKMIGFHRLEIMYSIDGDYELTNIIRPLGKYTKNYVFNILNMSRNYKTYNIVHSTISNMNILFLDKLIDVVLDNGKNIDNFDTYILAHPYMYHISNLPIRLRDIYSHRVKPSILEKISNYDGKHKKSILSLLNKIDMEINNTFDDNMWKLFKEDCLKKDNLTNTSLRNKIINDIGVDIYEL